PGRPPHLRGARKRRFGRFSPHTARPAALSVRHDGGSGHHRKDAPVHVSALLEFDAVPLETEDEVTVLLDITAPVRAAQEERPPSTLQVVLDRSSSMSRDDRLGGAVRALLSVVDRLDPVDRFGVVVFSDQARVLAPARSEEHTSELQSRENLVCRLLLEKKKNTVACKHKVD